ncbi:MAG: hypothetical protein ACQESF_00210 [Nanobdellota archaeon]
MGKKKGMEQSVLVKLIGVVASLIVLGLLFRNVFDITYGETAENICRMSVISHSKTQVAGSPIMNLKCPRKFILIDNEGYKIYYADDLPIDKEKLSYKIKFNEKTSFKKQFYELLANEMAECWYKLGEGNLDIFQEDIFFTKSSCVMCSEIGFSKEFEKSRDIGNIGEFNEYLKTHNFTKYGINTRYANFLYKNYDASFSFSHLAYFIQEDSISVLFDDETGFQTDESYLIYFKGYKFDKITKSYKWIGEKISGEKIEKIFPNDRYFVFFSEQSDVTKACYMMVN